MSVHVRASVHHDVSATGHDYGRELHIERYSDAGGRVSGSAFGGLSRSDLASIATAINVYLNLEGET